eukprot:14588-Heterococcus_DN1.PRE.2
MTTITQQQHTVRDLRWLEADDSSAVRCRMHTMLSLVCCHRAVYTPKYTTSSRVCALGSDIIIRSA